MAQSGTQRLPNPTASSAHGFPGTGTVETSVFVCGSIWLTAFGPVEPTHKPVGWPGSLNAYAGRNVPRSAHPGEGFGVISGVKRRLAELAVKTVSTIVLMVLLVAQTATAQKKTSIADGWIAAWNSHDPGEVAAIFTTDVLYEDVTLRAVNHGSAELRKFAASVFEAVPDMKFELVNSSVDRRHGSIEWIFSGTDHGLYKTGKRFSVRGVTAIDLRGGKISRNLDYYDAASIMRQVGLSPCKKTESSK